MTILRALGFLLLPVILVACQGAPLPKDDIPPDFYFFYRMERPVPVPEAPAAEAGTPAASKGAKKPRAAEPAGRKPGSEKPAGKKPGSEKPGGKKPGERKPATSARPRPAMVQIEIEADGKVEYEIRHRAPRPSRRRDEKTLAPEVLRKVYEAIRGAELFDLDDRYTGEDESLGTETFYVMGRKRRAKEVIVEGTEVPALATLRERLFELLRLEWRPAPERVTGFILDLRSGMVHRAGCPMVRDIPPASQRTLSRWEEAVDVRGAFPCEDCRPLEHR